MPRFFARFNNEHDISAANRIGTDVLAKRANCTETEYQRLLNEFEAIQDRRAEALKTRFGNRISQIHRQKVIFIGDSITKDNLGYRTAVTRAADLEACNLSVSGSTSPMLLYDVSYHLKEFRPTLVSLMIGSNDSLLIGQEKLASVSLPEYKRNISALVRWSLEAGARVLLFEIPPINENRFKERYSTLGKSQTNKNIETYNDVLRTLAKDYPVTLHTNRWLLEEPTLYFEPDGIHLSAEAHTVFAQKWMSAALES